jgi:hypothetical protein
MARETDGRPGHQQVTVLLECERVDRQVLGRDPVLPDEAIGMVDGEHTGQ